MPQTEGVQLRGQNVGQQGYDNSDKRSADRKDRRGQWWCPRAITSEDTIESLLFGRFARFLENHTLKVDLKGSDIVNAVSSTARSLSDNAEFEEEEDNSLTEEGRGKKKLKKKKKGLLRLIMGAGGIISAIIGKLALIKVALIAKKALIIAKIAFLLSAFLGIKKLLASKGGSSGKHTTIDAYPAEHHSSGHHDSGHGGHGGGSGGWSDWSSSGSSGSGGWGRSLDAQQLAYNAYPQAR